MKSFAIAGAAGADAQVHREDGARAPRSPLLCGAEHVALALGGRRAPSILLHVTRLPSSPLQRNVFRIAGPERAGIWPVRSGPPLKRPRTRTEGHSTAPGTEPHPPRRHLPENVPSIPRKASGSGSGTSLLQPSGHLKATLWWYTNPSRPKASIVCFQELKASGREFNPLSQHQPFPG